MLLLRETVLTSLAIGTYLNTNFTSTNQSFKKFSTSLKFPSITNFGGFGTACFAESDAKKTNLQRNKFKDFFSLILCR